MPALAELAAAGADPDDVLDTFATWASAGGRALYPAQEEALVEVFAGSNVILATPTGSGKSLVALGAHVCSLAAGVRSVYTAPIRALVSEKFFALCEDLGPRNVGMLTGDASINADAPVLCATAEILASMALRRGAGAPVGLVVMDEFHFYGDRDRGWAWQVPLVELTSTQWVLMSATLGDVRRLEAGLTARNGRSTAVVRSATRPVPLEHEYRHTPLHETVESLLAADRAPVYVVHFTQAAAVAHAQALTSAAVTNRDQRQAIAAELAGFRFAKGFGTTLARLLRHGIGVHHGGMLPKYRRLVERLTRSGHLRVICGTDTLGVGVNLPLRTVVFTGLAKYDGRTSRLLGAREFHQIAGRAGRPGFDDSGLVVVQAPEHVIDNERAAEKAAGDPRRLRKLVKSKPPRGFVPWTDETWRRLVGATPEPLEPSFSVSHTMLLDVLDRPGDGCADLRRLLTTNDEPRARQRDHIRRAVSLYRSLVGSGALQRLDVPDAEGRRIRVTSGLQVDFALTSPLSPFVLEAVPRLDRAASTWALDVVSVVEATLDDPRPILAAQLDRLRTETLTALKAEGMEYEARLEVLDGLEYPKPLREWTYDLYDAYRIRHPWAADHNVAPKSVARDLYERAMGFADYVAHYGLTRSEGLVLRYLSDTYKGLVRNVPEELKNDELLDITEWLGELVRQVDSSLIDEWRLLQAAAGIPDPAASAAAASAAEAMILGTGVSGPGSPLDLEPPAVTSNIRAFTVMVRNAAFRRLEIAARGDTAALAALERGEEADVDLPAGDLPGATWDRRRWDEALAAYRRAHDGIGIGAEARAARWCRIRPGPDAWTVRQVVDDPDGDHDWGLDAVVDLARSDATGEAILRTVGFGVLPNFDPGP